MPPARRMTGYRFLIEKGLGRDICSFARERYDAGDSLNEIAKKVSVKLGMPDDVPFTRQVLQKWCPDIPARPEDRSEPVSDEDDV